MSENLQKRLISIEQSAQYYGVHKDTIRRRIASGELKGYRFGKRLIRIDADELDALMHAIPSAGGHGHSAA